MAFTCGTISDRHIARVKALGGGIAIQDRMAFPEEQINRLKSVRTVVDGRDPRRVCARRRGAVVHQAAAIQSAAGYPAFPDEVQAGSEFGFDRPNQHRIIFPV